jgi:hypothetical protein
MVMGVGRDSSVGIVTRYELDGTGIESRLGARFSAPVQTDPGAHPASCRYRVTFTGIKRPGRGVDHPRPCSAEVKERAIPLLLLWAFMVCYRVNSPLLWLRVPQQILRTHRSLKAYCATLWWRWSVFPFFLVMEHRWNETDRGKPKYSEEILSQCHFVHYKWLTRDRTRASAVRGRWLTAWAMARHQATCLLPNVFTNNTVRQQMKPLRNDSFIV